MRIPSWEVKIGYPLASKDVQRMFEPNWESEYSDQIHSVHVLVPGELYCRLNEDISIGKDYKGSGMLVFKHGDWALREAVYIDTRKAGWSLRLKILVREHKRGV